ncbi:MAG: murein hydrolase activator EnvC family protein, partial [Alphaproteobacteria bacterium]
TSALESRRGRLGRVLAALERIALFPPAALVALPGSAPDTFRAALLLAHAAPPLQADAAALGAELGELAQLRGEISVRRSELASAAAFLREERGQLDVLIADRTRLMLETEGERAGAAKRVQALAAEADDLRDLLARIEAAARNAGQVVGETAEMAALPPEGVEREETAPSQAALVMLRPVRGRVLRHYGQDGELGLTDRGVTVETQPGAQVVAPRDGRVAFAGLFRRYGQILIIDHGAGYHTLLAGLSRIDAVVGQWVLAGEPIGLMGFPENGKPELYVELRHDGQPINPIPWMVAEAKKVKG